MTEERDIDRLLRDIGDVVRQQEEGPQPAVRERLEDLVADKLSEEEARQLEIDAQDDPELAIMVDAFRPMDETSRARLFDAARGGLAKPAVTESRPWLARVLPTQWWAPAGVLAAAACLMLLIVPTLKESPLPSYRLGFEGAVRLERTDDPTSVPDGRSIVAQGNRVRVVLTPATAVEGAVDVRAGLFQDAAVTPLPAALIDVSGRGSVRIEGVLGDDLHVPTGAFDLLVAVGRRDEVPDLEELVVILEDLPEATEASWQAWRVPLRRPPAEPP